MANDPQRNANFCSGILGLRLVKLTVNFDPSTNHLNYGDKIGHPKFTSIRFASLVQLDHRIIALP
ncbi:MAG: hypothetical protein JRN15_09465 [Nitrososphaerota archaeon]|nr:hypothetical protein [Nitrososphaerota archaeon]